MSGSQPKSRVASVTFTRELLCLNRAVSILSITMQWQARPRSFDFFVMRVYYEKLGHMLKPLVPKFRFDLSVHLRDIAEKQFPAKLKPIVAEGHSGGILSIDL